MCFLSQMKIAVKTSSTLSSCADCNFKIWSANYANPFQQKLIYRNLRKDLVSEKRVIRLMSSKMVVQKILHLVPIAPQFCSISTIYRPFLLYGKVSCWCCWDIWLDLPFPIAFDKSEFTCKTVHYEESAWTGVCLCVRVSYFDWIRCTRQMYSFWLKIRLLAIAWHRFTVPACSMSYAVTSASRHDSPRLTQFQTQNAQNQTFKRAEIKV